MFDLQRFAGVRTYDPKKVVVIFGVRQLTGFSEDSLITIDPHGEGIQKYVGADGEVSRSLDPDTTYTITLPMASTSESNAFLSEIFTIDNETGEGMLPFMMKDLSGDTIFIAEQAWVTQPPSAEYGKTVNEFEWTIETGKVTGFLVGGND